MRVPRKAVSVLIVEDEPLSAIHLEMLLHERGFSRVRLAHDLQTAESLLVTSVPRLAILDVNIGPRPVFPFAEKVRALSIPFMFWTGLNRRELPPEWQGHLMLEKPASLRALDINLAALGFAPYERARSRGQPPAGKQVAETHSH